MPHVLDFQIGNMLFVNPVEGTALDEEVGERWQALSDVATHAWRRQKWKGCEINEGNFPFAIYRVEDPGTLWGVWVNYRARPVAPPFPNRVRCLAGPLFPDIKAIVHPAESSDQPILDASRAFWRRMFGIMEWQLDNPMPLEGGGELEIDRFRFPDVDDGDPEQHEWVDVEPLFDLYARKQVVFATDPHRGKRVPRMMLKANKPVHPDPGRPPVVAEPNPRKPRPPLPHPNA